MGLEKEKILIVDDMKTIRMLVLSALRSLGATNLEEAENGVIGWNLMKSALAAGRPFTLVVSDWNMPEMTGLELLKNCRFHDNYEKVSFILLTAETEAEHVQEAIKYRVDGYITKPFSQDKLIDLINKLTHQ